jgi:hypothetical protein
LQDGGERVAGSLPSRVGRIVGIFGKGTADAKDVRVAIGGRSSHFQVGVIKTSD